MIYYNEFEPFAAQWLRNLMDAGLIPAGDVDERSIKDVTPGDLRGYAQCHFFAGIGGWSRALQIARVSPAQALWTGSCPCQPFSTAGKRKGVEDERHLWPVWFNLIRVCRPPIIFGEQVANGAGAWLDIVFSDLESQGYAVGAAVLPASGVGAPHVRNRTWFVAHPHGKGEHAGAVDAEVAEVSEFTSHPERIELWQQSGWRRGANGAGAALAGEHGAQQHVADASVSGLSLPEQKILHGEGRWKEGRAASECSWWATEPDMGRVAHGIPNRVAKLRAIGNAIVPQVAAEFIGAYFKCKSIPPTTP